MNIRVPGKAQAISEAVYLGKCITCHAIIEVPFKELHIRSLTAPESAHLNVCPACKKCTSHPLVLWLEGTEKFKLFQKEIEDYERLAVARNLGTD